VAQDQVDERLSAALASVARGDFERAENLYRALIADHPGLAEAHAGLADALVGQSREDEAYATLLVAGQGLVRSGEVDAGIGFLDRAVSLRPDNAAGNAALGDALLRANRHREARNSLEKAIELGEQEPIVRLFLGAAQWESGAYDEAERTYREILLTDGPTVGAARRSLGALLVFRGRYESAVPLLAAAMGVEAESQQLRYELARALEGSGRTAEAAELFAVITVDTPRFLQAHFRLANLLRASGDSDGARHHMETFRDLHAENQRETRELGRLEARLKQGWSLLRERRHDEARRLFSTLPETPDTLTGLAEACRRGGDREAAVLALRRALELDPERFDLRLALDEILIETQSP
jgi:tetratricopeptide (TPR) repeat protein